MEISEQVQQTAGLFLLLFGFIMWKIDPDALHPKYHTPAIWLVTLGFMASSVAFVLSTLMRIWL